VNTHVKQLKRQGTTKERLCNS